MTEQPNDNQRRERDLTAELHLHPERPPVMRLPRKVIIGLATIAALTVSVALIWALTQSSRKPVGGGELFNTESKPTPDALAALPRDYAAIPKPSPPPVPPGVPPLGPPLPGDLGRPMLGAGVPPSESFLQSIPPSKSSLRSRRRRAPANCLQR